MAEHFLAVERDNLHFTVEDFIGQEAVLPDGIVAIRDGQLNGLDMYFEHIARPMLPKKGCRGMSIPSAKWPSIFWRSRGIIFILRSKISSDRKPFCPMAL